jgi:hypothetical protein
MKLLLPLLLLTTVATAQRRENYWLKQGINAGLMFTAGFLHGTNEVAVHDYRRYAARHPNARPEWANPKVSFRNKYADFPHDLSPAYPGAKTWLAWSTDAYHLRSTGRNLLTVGSLGVSMSLWERPNWKKIAVQAAASWAAFAVGTGAAHAYYKPI